MHGAVFGALIVAIAVILIAGMPLLIIPVVLLAALAFVAIPMLKGAKDTNMRPTGAAPSGVPTTREASYDPAGDATHRPTA
jgi:hypothetical protein